MRGGISHSCSARAAWNFGPIALAHRRPITDAASRRSGHGRCRELSPASRSGSGFLGNPSAQHFLEEVVAVGHRRVPDRIAGAVAGLDAADLGIVAGLVGKAIESRSARSSLRGGLTTRWSVDTQRSLVQRAIMSPNQCSSISSAVAKTEPTPKTHSIVVPPKPFQSVGRRLSISRTLPFKWSADRTGGDRHRERFLRPDIARSTPSSAHAERSTDRRLAGPNRPRSSGETREATFHRARTPWSPRLHDFPALPSGRGGSVGVFVRLASVP